MRDTRGTFDLLSISRLLEVEDSGFENFDMTLAHQEKTQVPLKAKSQQAL